MIVDVHAHWFRSSEGFSTHFLAQAQRAKGQPVDLVTHYDEYWSASGGCEKVIVFGGKARRSGLWVPDCEVAEFAQSDPTRVIGFMSLDPTVPGWQEEMRHGHKELGLRGIKLMPMYAGFYPNDRSLDPLWSYAQEHGLPVLLHTGTTFVSQAPLDCTLPRHIDEVAIRFPEARIIMAHLGHPYEGECIVVVRKHPNVYTDISALHYRPWQLFHSLMLVQEYGVWDKVLLGSDFPFTTIEATIRDLRKLAKVQIGGFSLSEERIEKLIRRNPLPELGLA